MEQLRQQYATRIEELETDLGDSNRIQSAQNTPSTSLTPRDSRTQWVSTGIHRNPTETKDKDKNQAELAKTLEKLHFTERRLSQMEVPAHFS